MHTGDMRTVRERDALRQWYREATRVPPETPEEPPRWCSCGRGAVPGAPDGECWHATAGETVYALAPRGCRGVDAIQERYRHGRYA